MSDQKSTNKKVLRFQKSQAEKKSCPTANPVGTAPKKEWEILSFVTIKEAPFVPGMWAGGRVGTVHPIVDSSKGLYLWGESRHDLNSFLNTVFCVKSGHLAIRSVKRNSDGEVFTVGDKVKTVIHKIGDMNRYKPLNPFIIEKIELTGGEMCIRFEHTKDEFPSTKSALLKSLISLTKRTESFRVGIMDMSGSCPTFTDAPKREKLFTTEDGVDIFEGDVYFFVNTRQFNSIKPYTITMSAPANKEQVRRDAESNGLFVNFCGDQKAKEYIIMNKPCLSFNEAAGCVDGWETVSNLKALAKSKING